MQTTTFDPNFSIFNKKFIPEFVTPKEPIDLEWSDGDQFWPKQYNSPNRVKKFISKSIKYLKHKFTQKGRKGKNAVAIKDAMISKITYRTASSTEKSIIEIDDININSSLSIQDVPNNIRSAVSACSLITLEDSSYYELMNLIEQSVGYSLSENYLFVQPKSYSIKKN